MGKLKDELNKNEDVQQFTLNESEMNYLRLLNLVLQYHTWAQRIMSGFLYYVATNRLGYQDGVNLQFEIDLDKKDSLLTIKMLPESVVQEAQAAAEATSDAEPPAPSK